MSIIRQGSLFDIQDLYNLEPTHRFESIFSTLHIEPLLAEISKKTIVGAPTELNYAAMIYAMVARIVERIPTVKDLRKRLKNDFILRLECGFLFSDQLPSEASFSRLAQKLANGTGLKTAENQLLLQAIEEGFIEDEALAIDARTLNRETVQKQKRKSQNLSPRNEAAKPKLKKKPTTSKNKKRKLSKHCLKNPLLPNLMSRSKTFVIKFHWHLPGELRKTAKERTFFGMALKGILP
jgi:transposase